MRLLLAVCFVVVLGGNARAEQFVETRGFGDVPCATYAEVYRKYQDEGEVNNKYFSWALGFISGINVMQESFFVDLGAKTEDEMKRYLRQYCDAHPLANYKDGVRELMKTLPIIRRQK